MLLCFSDELHGSRNAEPDSFTLEFVDKGVFANDCGRINVLARLQTDDNGILVGRIAKIAAAAVKNSCFVHGNPHLQC